MVMCGGGYVGRWDGDVCSWVCGEVSGDVCRCGVNVKTMLKCVYLAYIVPRLSPSHIEID